jgi:NTE family protein
MTGPDPSGPLGRPFAGWPRPLAFAISGGGAYGSVHVGMLMALAEHGVRPDLVVGTSVGSLNGAVVASRPDDAVELLTNLWSRMGRRELFGHGWPTAVVNLIRTNSLSRLDRLAALIDSELDIGTFEELAVPFAAVATDAFTGEPELLSSGPLKPALLASSAVPGLFPHVTVNGRTYVDGGISAHIPIRQAIAFGARSVVALDASPPPPQDVPRSLVAGLLHSVALIVRNQRSHAVDELASRYPIATVPSATPPDLGSFNFSRTQELIERSYELACAALEAWAAGEVVHDELAAQPPSD